MTTMSVIAQIAAERLRQQTAEGWTPTHDDLHDAGEMAKAAACYAYFASCPDNVRDVAALHPRKGLEDMHILRRMWKWGDHWWKPKDRRRDLIRAAALIVAEIERLDRKAAQQ